MKYWWTCGFLNHCICWHDWIDQRKRPCTWTLASGWDWLKYSLRAMITALQGMVDDFYTCLTTQGEQHRVTHSVINHIPQSFNFIEQNGNQCPRDPLMLYSDKNLAKYGLLQFNMDFKLFQIHLLWINDINQYSVQEFLRHWISFLDNWTHHIQHKILNFIRMILTETEEETCIKKVLLR